MARESDKQQLVGLEELQRYVAKQQAAGLLEDKIVSFAASSNQPLAELPLELLLPLSKQLQSVVLAFHAIHHLPLAVGQLQALRHLNLSRNQLSAVPSSIGNLQYLEDLDLSHNCLVQLPASLGQLKQLRQGSGHILAGLLLTVH